MAKVFNPWESPPSTNTLTGDLASFEINGNDGPMEAGDSETEAEAPETPEPEDMMMQQALQVISQQADLIANLMKTLGK